MSLALGIDTGGTYTDAVLLRDGQEVVAKAKALTTRSDLAVGIAEAASRALKGVDPGAVGLVALSTTLATNAVVEGQGERVALVVAGFGDEELERAGLHQAMAGEPVLSIGGAMDHAGEEAAPLDLGRLEEWLATVPDVSAYAVAGLFAVRNPAHEIAMTETIRSRTGRPVSASHMLSARLGGPRRALTAVLNARLIGLTDRMIAAATERLARLGVKAPVMVVRGDGALISAAQARARPVETILSGPAASIVGARWLTGREDAIVADIGGTTTDIAILRGGRPRLDPDGARVGGWRTMVEAVAMHTHGLGGDSEVTMTARGLRARVTLGPRRVLPVALAAVEAPDVVHEELDRALRAEVPGEHDGQFVRASGVAAGAGLSGREQTVLERIGTTFAPLSRVIRQRLELGVLNRLASRGLVQMAGATPTDAAHVLGLSRHWNGAAAEKALRLLGRRRTGSGAPLGENAEEVARLIVDELEARTTAALLQAAFEEDGFADIESLPGHPLARAGLSRHRGAVRVEVGLGLPVIGLGASAPTWYRALGDRLGCEVVIPRNADVANAIGAVVGRIGVRREGAITQPAEGRFRAHLPAGPEDFASPEEAFARLEAVLAEECAAEARAAGAGEIAIDIRRSEQTAEVEGRETFVSGRVAVEASGRPRAAR